MLEQMVQTIILGLIQGFTEWLPISSTAHLRIAEHFWDLKVTPLFNVALHLGTLVVIVFFFRKEVRSILLAVVHLDFKSEYGQLVPPIIIATVPTAIIGLVYVQFLEVTLQTMLAIGITYLVGATIVYTSRVGKENSDTINYTVALIIGAAQGFAIFPGLSRSGVTISAALLLGLKRERAFDFSFLLSIPAIIGDLVVETYSCGGQPVAQGTNSIGLLAGVLVAAIVGYFSIKLVSKMVIGKKFHYFAFYTWAIGLTLITLVLAGR